MGQPLSEGGSDLGGSLTRFHSARQANAENTYRGAEEIRSSAGAQNREKERGRDGLAVAALPPAFEIDATQPEADKIRPIRGALNVIAAGIRRCQTLASRVRPTSFPLRRMCHPEEPHVHAETHRRSHR